MSLAGITRFRSVLNMRSTELSQGELSDVFIRFGRFPFIAGGEKMSHGVIINTNIAGSSDIQVGSFYNGASAVSAVVEMWAATLNANLSAGDTITIVGPLATLTYTAVASGATGDQFNLGGTAALTATAFAAVADADAATLGLAASSAVTAVGAVVTFAGAASGASFRVETTRPELVDIAKTQAGVAAVSATSAKCILKISGTEFVTGSQTYFTIKNFEYPAGSGNYDVELEMGVVTRSGDTQQSILARLRSLFLALAANTGIPDPDAMMYRIGPPTRMFTRADLATALQQLVDVPANMGALVTLSGTGSSATLTINAKSGLGGGPNNLSIETRVEGSLPTPLIDIKGRQFNMDNWLHMGGELNYALNDTLATSDVPVDNQQPPLTTTITGENLQGSFTVVQNYNLRFLNVASSTTGLSAYKQFLSMLKLGAKSVQQHYSVLHLSESSTKSGLFRGMLLFDCISTGGANRDRSRTNAPALPIQFRPLACPESPGCLYGYDFEYDLNLVTS